MRAALLALWAAAAVFASPPAAPRDTQPWWSPQGTTLAFQRESPGPGNGDVFYAPAVRGEEADIIGAGRARGFRPGSGELLVEVGAETSVRDASDRELGRIAGTDATWSPDGARVAFLAGDVLAVSEPSGAGVVELATGIAPAPTDSTGPVWSPDGTALAVASGSSLEIVPLDGTAPYAAFDAAGDPVANPSWSHDGSAIAFERSTAGRLAIWAVAPDGADPRELFPATGNNRHPQWSPIDGRLAFLSDRAGSYGLYVGGDGAAQLLLAQTAPESPARWSFDGSMLAVSSALDCKRFGIYVVRTAGPTQPVRRTNQCRIGGTIGDDLIYGTPYSERIDGYGGNDRLFAGNGDDAVYGGTGNDGIGGGPGNDLIDGGPGDDVLSGAAGNDVIHGGPGRDRIGCGPGNDTAYVGPGDRTVGCEHLRRG